MVELSVQSQILNETGGTDVNCDNEAEDSDIPQRQARPDIRGSYGQLFLLLCPKHKPHPPNGMQKFEGKRVVDLAAYPGDMNIDHVI